MAPGESNSMELIASYYRTVVTRVSLAGADWQQVLQPNPRRWYVRFDMDAGGLFTQGVLPAPAQEILPPANQFGLPSEWKFVDAPSAVTGAWFGVANPAGDLIVTEVIYTR